MYTVTPCTHAMSRVIVRRRCLFVVVVVHTKLSKSCMASCEGAPNCWKIDKFGFKTPDVVQL